MKTKIASKYALKFLTIGKNRAVFLLLVFLLTGCPSGGGDGAGQPGDTPVDLWTWISGSDVVNQPGVYGEAAGTNVPGGREAAVSWIDGSGDLWLFGGFGFDSAGTLNRLNDLWRWDGINWTWVSGSAVVNQPGVYGEAAGSNVPGARSGSVSWIDGSGDLWLFGGYGYDSAGAQGSLNDLWRGGWDGTNWIWTWISGSDVVNKLGDYGTQDTAAGTNVPGARDTAVSWIDGRGDLWLFGGDGYDSAGAQGSLNDLWRWDGTNWTWISGSDVVTQTGNYGTKGTAADTNVPGARIGSISWIDGNGDLWLFGGYGYDSVGVRDSLNDLWRWDRTNWTWVSGSDVVGQIGVYGMKGTAAGTNVPGARDTAVSWIDGSGDLWLFGGNGYDSETGGSLNDLWRWDGTNWTWVSGSNVVNQLGVYGTKGTAAGTNVPGAKRSPISWIDGSGDLWLFGGYGYVYDNNINNTHGWLNDLWRYEP